ncbi:hypothetical protein YS110_06535 [Acidovorax sp. YS12]|nr:hypothetical protein YS110_06535 [Acidovorax sp. YS12]
MARPKQQQPSEKLVLSVSPQIRQYLDALVPVGLYGKSAPEVAANLMSRALEQLARDGLVKLHVSDDGD